MSTLLLALTKQRLCLDFAALKHACPKGIYVAPLPDQPLQWHGVFFVRKGPYAKAILRFQVDFPVDYPQRPPVITFRSDVFHPLVTPLNTYTHTARDTGAETVSAADRDHLPPGGLSLRHAFPEWFESARDGSAARAVAASAEAPEHGVATRMGISPASSAALTVEVLQYLRVVFDTEAMLDSIPFEAAANTGAWHAWSSFRAKTAESRIKSTGVTSKEQSSSPRPQPGGARRPREWNWQGVWEDRVKKSIQASLADHMLYAPDEGDVICFSKLDSQAVSDMLAADGSVIT